MEKQKGIQTIQIEPEAPRVQDPMLQITLIPQTMQTVQAIQKLMLKVYAKNTANIFITSIKKQKI